MIATTPKFFLPVPNPEIEQCQISRQSDERNYRIMIMSTNEKLLHAGRGALIIEKVHRRLEAPAKLLASLS
jgi:hypothetical protein